MNRALLSRRELLRFGALSLGGLTLADQMRSLAFGATRGSARHCIFVFLNGRPALLDTFAMKPETPAEIRGPYRPIETSVPSVRITEKLPKLAQLAQHFAILRSATHSFSAHNRQCGVRVERPFTR